MNSQDRHYIFENFNIESKFHFLYHSDDWRDHHEIDQVLTNYTEQLINIAIFSLEKKKNIFKEFFVVKEPEGENEGKNICGL